MSTDGRRSSGLSGTRRVLRVVATVLCGASVVMLGATAVQERGSARFDRWSAAGIVTSCVVLLLLRWVPEQE
jgi:hypothetical protein